MTSSVAGSEHEIAIVPSWPALARVRAYSTLRTGGVSRGGYASLNLGAHVGDDPASVAENRRRVVERLGLPSEPCWLEQVHGTRVLDLDSVAQDGGTHSGASAGAPDTQEPAPNDDEAGPQASLRPGLGP